MRLHTVSKAAIIREMDADELQERYEALAAKKGQPTNKEFDEVLLIAAQYRQLTGMQLSAPYAMSQAQH